MSDWLVAALVSYFVVAVPVSAWMILDVLFGDRPLEDYEAPEVPQARVVRSRRR